jgi:hypothetical protein
MMVIEEKGQSPTERSEACADFAIGSDATEWARFSLRLIAGFVCRNPEWKVRASISASKRGGFQ